MTRQRLMQEMDAAEVMKWMAYEMTIDPDRNKKWVSEIEQEHLAKLADSERAELIRKQFNVASGIE